MEGAQRRPSSSYWPVCLPSRWQRVSSFMRWKAIRFHRCVSDSSERAIPPSRRSRHLRATATQCLRKRALDLTKCSSLMARATRGALPLERKACFPLHPRGGLRAPSLPTQPEEAPRCSCARTGWVRDAALVRIANQFHYRSKALAGFFARLQRVDPSALCYVTSDHLPPVFHGSSLIRVGDSAPESLGLKLES